MSRLKRIEAVQSRLSWPSIILLITATVGFLTSLVLLQFGLDSMALRYPIAIGVAYGTFLLMLRLWLSIQNFWNIDVPLDTSKIDLLDVSQYQFGGGGDFAGAGAGGQWGEANLVSEPLSDSVLEVPIIELEDIGLLILAAVAILTALLAVFYVAYIAPVLLAEIFVDGVLISGLYKSVKGVDQRHWLSTALRKTLLPALLAALLFGATGYFVQKAVPDAHSIGQVWIAVKSD